MVSLPTTSHLILVASKSFFEELNLFFKFLFPELLHLRQHHNNYCRLEASTSKSSLLLTVDSGMCYAKVTISFMVNIEFIEQSVIIFPF